ncbi:MAG: hypothetical protein N3E51_01440 [Candidatus Micrarchaeota archaeon]|nr:hypothetical protein [Candidatus Micrarchaeota archaeon]
MSKIACLITDSSERKIAHFALNAKTSWAVSKLYLALKARSAYDHDTVKGVAKARLVRKPQGVFLHIRLLEGANEAEQSKNRLFAEALQGRSSARQAVASLIPYSLEEDRKREKEQQRAADKKFAEFIRENELQIKIAKCTAAFFGMLLFPVAGTFHGRQIAAFLKEKLILRPLERAFLALSKSGGD